jgi:hypothetical protein
MPRGLNRPVAIDLVLRASGPTRFGFARGRTARFDVNQTFLSLMV